MKSSFWAVLFLAGLAVHAQDRTGTEIRLNTKALQLDVDPLDNVYILTDSLQLKKYGPDLRFLQLYSDNKLTDATRVITENPFKTILFNPDFGYIKILDTRLGPIAEFSVFSLDIINISSVGASADYQSLWMYDDVQQRLIRVDQQFRVTFSQNNLQEETGSRISPTSIVETGGWLYLYDPEQGVYVFDNLGTYYKTIPILGAESFQVKSGLIYYQNEEDFIKYNLQTLLSQRVQLQGVQGRYLRTNHAFIIYSAEERKLIKLSF